MATAVDIAKRDRYDMLFPTQEQVTVLSWAAEHLDGVTTLAPDFESLRVVQDKIAAHATLLRLGIPQPATPSSTISRSYDTGTSSLSL